MSATESELLSLLEHRRLGVLATLKRDGRPQLSNVNYAYLPEERCILVSVIASLAKARNLERDPRASFHVMSADGWSWTVAEGTASLSPVAADPRDEAVEELIGLYRRLAGEHPDWAEYRAAMVTDRRRVIRLNIERAYGRTGG